MSLASKYDPVQIEDKWYKIWQEKGFFNSKPNSDAIENTPNIFSLNIFDKNGCIIFSSLIKK